MPLSTILVVDADCFPFCILRIRNGVSNDIFHKDLESSTYFLVNEAGDPFPPSAA
jgi:hypothetical protein